MRKYDILGLWIRSAAVGPLAFVFAFLAAYALANWYKRRKTGAGFGGLFSVMAFAAVLLFICFPYPAYVLQRPILNWAAKISEASQRSETFSAGERPTVIFVMGGGISVKTSVPSSYSLARIDHGLRVLQRAPGAYFLFSDGGLERENGGEWMRQYLLAAGVPRDRILLEEKAATTQQNFEFGKQLMAENGLADAHVILVTSAFHVPRSYYTAKGYGFDPELEPLHEHVDLTFYPSWFSLLHLSAILNEYIGIAAYWVLGWL